MGIDDYQEIKVIFMGVLMTFFSVRQLGDWLIKNNIPYTFIELEPFVWDRLGSGFEQK